VCVVFCDCLHFLELDKCITMLRYSTLRGVSGSKSDLVDTLLGIMP